MRKRNQTAVTLCALAVFLLLNAKPAYAHKLKLFATAEGEIISGYAYVSGGARLRDQTVQVLSPGGDKLGKTRTNEKGEFTFTARCKCDHLLRIDAGDGHGAGFVVKAHELPDDLPVLNATVTKITSEAPAQLVSTETAGQHELPAKLEDVISKAVSKQIRPLREQLDRLEEKIRLRDILGGVGYILGITGIAFYFLGVRKIEKSRSSAGSSQH